jgi:hypothetical protein
MLNLLRSLIVAAAMCAVVGPAMGGEPDEPAPRQSRPQQLAQSCRTTCMLELQACERTCDSAAVRIDCLAQCQGRFSICTSTCR